MMPSSRSPGAGDLGAHKNVLLPTSAEHNQNNQSESSFQGLNGGVLKPKPGVWCEARRVQNEATLLVAKNSLKPSPKPKFRPLPSLEEISAAFDVDPNVGLPINKKQRPKLPVGAVCGTTKTDYVTVYLKGTPWRWHRLAWKLYNGNDPVGLIDHVNGNKRDNSEANLRDVDYLTNSRNRHEVLSSSGFIGVSWCESSLRWIAHISCGNRNLNLGRFREKDCAIAARKHAESILFVGGGVAE